MMSEWLLNLFHFQFGDKDCGNGNSNQISGYAAGSTEHCTHQICPMNITLLLIMHIHEA